MTTKFINQTVSFLGVTAVVVGLSAFPAHAEGTSQTLSVSGTGETTSASDLLLDPTTQAVPQDNLSVEQPQPTAQVAQQVVPGTPTRSGPSYIGVGGNIGFGGGTTLSQGSFAVFSKVGLTQNFSFRPAALFGDNTLFLVPVTVDFPAQAVADTGEQQLGIAPYIGGGAAISTGRDSTVGFLLTGGVDVPISPEFTATAGVNVGFVDETEVGVLLGVGYNF